MFESLGDAEREAVSRLNVELDEHLKLTEAAFNLASEAMESLGERPLSGVPQSLKVAVALLNKVSNDLRTATLLALYGYATQAAALVASLYESAFTVAFAGSDDNLAQRWIDHDDPTRTFENVHEMTRSALEKLGVPDAEQQASVEYQVYRQLCMAKHGNPLYVMQHAFRRVGNDIASHNAPDTSDSAIRAAWFALEHGAALAFIALASFIGNHAPQTARASLVAKLHEIGLARKALEAKAKARWSTEDPFPGKWRT